MQYSIRLLVAILTFIIGITAAHYLRGTYKPDQTVAPARHVRTNLPPNAVDRSTLSVCELSLHSTAGAKPDQVRVRGTVANFEMDDPKIFDLDCEWMTTRVYCSSKDSNCSDIFADLKAAEAASVKMELVGEYVGPRRDEGSAERRLRIDRIVEIGPVSFPFDADVPYPAISGRRNQPVKRPLGSVLRGFTPR